jgi:hypothetical protein
VVYLLSFEVVGRGLAWNETDVPVGTLLTRVQRNRYHVQGRRSLFVDIPGGPSVLVRVH